MADYFGVMPRYFWGEEDKGEIVTEKKEEAGEVKNAVVVLAAISVDIESGDLIATVALRVGYNTVLFGPDYPLYGPAPRRYSGGRLLKRIMDVAGVHNWDKLTDRAVRVRLVDGKVAGIGHIIDDNWFNPETDL
jgi:hypothetical protein